MTQCLTHGYWLECLELYNINRTLRIFINNSKGLWKTTRRPIAQVDIKCGMNPLSHIITKSDYGYRFRSGVSISHLLYIETSTYMLGLSETSIH